MENDPTGRKAGVKRQFNSAAANYDVGAGVFAHFGQRLVAVAEIAPGHRVLDVASGRGAVLFPADEKAGASGHATGVDLAEEMVQATNEEAARRGLRARVQVMDAEHLALPDESFDVVVAQYVITAVPHPEATLDEFVRVIRPGGEIVLINHIGAESGPRALFEKCFAPIARRLGWRPEFRFQTLSDWAEKHGGVRVIERRPMPPLGHFSLIRFERVIDSESRSAA